MAGITNGSFCAILDLGQDGAYRFVGGVAVQDVSSLLAGQGEYVGTDKQLFQLLEGPLTLKGPIELGALLGESV